MIRNSKIYFNKLFLLNNNIIRDIFKNNIVVQHLIYSITITTFNNNIFIIPKLLYNVRLS